MHRARSLSDPHRPQRAKDDASNSANPHQGSPIISSPARGSLSFYTDLRREQIAVSLRRPRIPRIVALEEAAPRDCRSRTASGRRGRAIVPLCARSRPRTPKNAGQRDRKRISRAVALRQSCTSCGGGRRSAISASSISRLAPSRCETPRAGSCSPCRRGHCGPAGARKFFETRRPGIEVYANDRWWFLVAHTVPARYQWRSTRELVERYHARELAPKPSGMSEETYLRLTGNPAKHRHCGAATGSASSASGRPPEVQPRDGRLDQHPLDFAGALGDREDSGIIGGPGNQLLPGTKARQAQYSQLEGELSMTCSSWWRDLDGITSPLPASRVLTM